MANGNGHSRLTKWVTAILIVLPLLTAIGMFELGLHNFNERLTLAEDTLEQMAVVLRDRVPDAIAKGIKKGQAGVRTIAERAAKREVRNHELRHHIVEVRAAFTGRPCFGRSITLRDNRPVIFGTAQEDVIRAGQGPQSVFSLGGYDRVCTGRGADEIDAQNPLNPSSDYDRADGGRGRDSCNAELRKRCEG